MLVLTRRVGESIRVGNDIVVTLVQMAPGKVRIGIQAPDDTLILREELVDPRPTVPAIGLSPASSVDAPAVVRGS